MNLLGPTRFNRLNEACAVVFLFGGLFLCLSFLSYQPEDPSWDAVSAATRAQNLTGVAGAYIADLCLQFLGLAAFGLPAALWFLAWRWVRSRPIESGFIKLVGLGLFLTSLCAALALAPQLHPWRSSINAGGVAGILVSDYLLSKFNFIGTLLCTGVALILSAYILSRFSMFVLAGWFEGPARCVGRMIQKWQNWRQARRIAAEDRARQREEKRAQARAERRAAQEAKEATAKCPAPVEARPPAVADTPPWTVEPQPEPARFEEIPIQELADEPRRPEPVYIHSVPAPEPPPPATEADEPKKPEEYHLPPTDLLNEPPVKSPYDSSELKDIAAKIKSKLEEFNVLGNVVQINPGPVVTTFEFKPEAGIKYSRITTLNEDLCLGLQAESILIERIPGKPTVGVEVPNSRREVISLRQILESEEFQNSASHMTICLGKDINGRIKVAALESMPHLLIAGSTGSGKSVMLNCLIMSILYKATPDEVRMILVDPKRLEMGLYEGIPHLLTPVITDAKKATNALRNAVLEMERRLKLLASQGVRNIDQYNRKVRQLREQPRSLFDENPIDEEALKPLPFILILIDELADLMMLEKGNVEEAVTRLAQMARAVGMHLVLATQRPSVDVITGLIKANFPSRISFRVATRVDSRTVLDVMGAEHLLGKGDMLFLPPGSSRLVRVHGGFVSETETNKVVEFWKKQARPDYDQSFLLAPPSDDEKDEEDGEGEFEGGEDPRYQDAVRVVLEVGKASTSTLQRRLRLGYGRAARILDMMQRDGIIGPPDGSKPREVLKRPDWLEEVGDRTR
jgi:S-DNA-T family DNA segregation ATPase FtsK/SpoIIIE